MMDSVPFCMLVFSGLIALAIRCLFGVEFAYGLLACLSICLMVCICFAVFELIKYLRSRYKSYRINNDIITIKLESGTEHRVNLRFQNIFIDQNRITIRNLQKEYDPTECNINLQEADVVSIWQIADVAAIDVRKEKIIMDEIM